MNEAHPTLLQDPLYSLSRVLTWLYTRWLRHTYKFAEFGEAVSIHHSCDISRRGARGIQIGDEVWLGSGLWLNVPPETTSPAPQIVFGRSCSIGRRCIISAKNRITLEEYVLFAPSVLVMDHNHEFSDVDRPIHVQGVTDGGEITIERNCWLGYGAVVLCNAGQLTIGRNSVVGANSVVTKSFPPYSVIAGNPARLLKTFDPSTGSWIKPS